MKKALIIIAALLVLAGGGFYVYKTKASSDDGKYITQPVKKGDIVSSVSATGKLQAKVSVLVGTEVSGTIRQILTDYNRTVKKGQVLVKLDQELFQAQVDLARANLMNAQAKLREMESGRGIQSSSVKTAIDEKKANMDKTEADFKRNQTLFDKGMISRSDLDTSRQAYLVAKAQHEQVVVEVAKNDVTDAQIAEAKAAVKQSQASLRTAETNLSKTVIRSPMDGVVIDRTVEVGQTVAASFNTPNLLTIGDLAVMQVEVSIDEADVGQAKVGQKAHFTVDAFPDRVFEGTLAQVYYAPVTVQNVVTYTGIVEVANKDGLLRPGMTANVKIITSEKKDVLLVPNSALRVKIDQAAREKKSKGAPGMKKVWVLKDKKPQEVKVKLGVTDFNNTEVISGLSEGDNVIVDTAGKPAGGASTGGGGGSRGGGMMRM
jgi:HlyD family secretion protein